MTGMNETKYGVLSNHDMDFYRRFEEFTTGKNLTKDNVHELLEDYFEHNLSPHISDYIINLSGLSSSVPSKVISFMSDIYERKIEDGVPVDWTDNPNLKFCHLLYCDYGIELFEELFSFLKKKDCRAWISFRMNDCHHSHERVSPLRSDFFYTAKNNGWMVGEKYGYWSTCLDFSVKEVREYLLSYINEQIVRYDVYGVEWDFMREAVCFDYLERNDCCEIMTDFFRELKRSVEKAEHKWGHPIKINVRFLRDIEQNKIFGFDIPTLVNEKLFTSVTVTPRFNITDSDMPISDWKKLLEGSGIELYAGVEMLSYNFTFNDDKVISALTRKYLSQGADKIYLFNYFFYINFRNFCFSYRFLYKFRNIKWLMCKLSFNI